MMTSVLRACAGGTACATKSRSWGTKSRSCDTKTRSWGTKIRSCDTKTRSWGTKSRSCDTKTRSWGTTTSPVVAVVGQAVPPARPVGGDCFQRRRRDAR